MIFVIRAIVRQADGAFQVVFHPQKFRNSRMSSQRVVITGLGVVSPIGTDLDTLWSSLASGRSGIAQLSSLPPAANSLRFGAEVRDFTGAIEDYGPLNKVLQRSIKKNMKVMCREIEMGVAAAQKALSHSGLTENRIPERCGCLFGCDYILTRPEEFADGLNHCRQKVGTEGGIAELVTAWPELGLPKVNPLWLLKYLPNMPNSHVSIYNDFRGPNNAITVREASMHLSLSEASSIIRRGAADVMLVGATGSRIHPLRTTQVILSEAVASEQTDPTTMSRPFDATCDGAVLGEGAGAVMIESLEHAQARGAKIWGEVIGSGASMVGSSGRPSHLRQAILQALRSTVTKGGQHLGSDWHLHAQGLSSPKGDRAEAMAISDLFMELGYSRPVTAAKSYFGNLGAGGAAVELICSLLALEHGRLFPIRSLKKALPEVKWSPVVEHCPSGAGFVHSSYSLQGQAACVAIKKFL